MRQGSHIFVAALGNMPYPLTRHSVGQLIVDGLAMRLGISMRSERGGHIGHGTLRAGAETIPLTLFKSKYLMNVSGPSIVAACRKTVGSPQSMVVISDSLSHKPMALSVRLGGSANGHNGVKSIIAALGQNTDFWRMRVGIGKNAADATEYVMHRLSPPEIEYWRRPGLDAVLREVEKIALQTTT
ncbi:peptidyl-tRNA hydrolase [Fistulina hepatica ATCC 64428]|uniref:peptidyl-tRNA hydrolase n=1 Tax=Fistulina hepatica ATCC 64428 TaxID=1128425 RepID=A0A0D7ARK0_9AGAR|nr:peptidyl-tRNA hydrolase [Fistulina hepatica ATCC 64428]